MGYNQPPQGYNQAPPTYPPPYPTVYPSSEVQWQVVSMASRSLSTKLSEASQTSKKKQTATHFIWRIQVWDRLLCHDLPTGWMEFKEKLWLLSQDSYPVVDFSTVSFNVLVTRIAWQVILPEVRHFISSNHGGCLRKYSNLVFRWIQICLHRISAFVYDVSIYSIES